MPISNMQELFLHELAEIYDAEHTFVVGQEAMVQGASDEALKGAIVDYIEQTREHARNIERVFENLGYQEPRRETNEAAQGLVNEARQGLQEAQSSELRDCAIVSAVIKVEHFEMGSYRSLVTAVKQIGLMNQGEAENLLNENLRQEEETAQIAEQSVPELIRAAEKAVGRQGGQQQEDKRLVDKLKDSLTDQ